jgi:manganese/zinc/iron transport system substrate-binding protein
MIACTLFAVFAGIAALSAASAEPVVRVTATTNLVADLVAQVGGERVAVQSLMGPGVDPHLYKATAPDVIKLQNADIIFYSGLHLEGRMTDVFTRVARQGRLIYALSEAMPEDQLLHPAGSEGLEDPHIWFDPELWVFGVDAVLDGLSTFDPEGTDYYASRAKNVRAEILATHEWAKGRVALVPLEKRILITSHDAFAYFGRAYDFRVVAIQGISTVTEAGLADVVAMIDFIKSENVPAIFVESSVPRATIERVGRDSGARVGGELFSDALGAAGDIHTFNDDSYDVGTWAGMLKHNVNTIVNALGSE